ncbi:multidrug and toxin extrusion protein 2-like [Manis javanica]|uniref:multidrug and toxin extrusion protein 2-like n=1 Tax=Manis javanica TaxID=9974 RepID=UPI003C6D60CE
MPSCCMPWTLEWLTFGTSTKFKISRKKTSLVTSGGSAWANTTSQLFLCALLFLHVWWRKIYVHTWGGLWYGLIVCVFFQALFYSVYIWKINCNRVAEQAQVRAGLKGIKETMPVPTDLPILEKDVTDGVALPDIIRPESQSFQLMESNSLSSN